MRPSRAYLALAAAGSIWGTGFFFGKIALGELDVPHMILYRLLLACAGFLPVIVMRPVAIRRADWPTLLLSALFGVPLNYLIQFEGLARTTVAHASLMVATMPILLGVAAALITRERPTVMQWVCLIVSAGGALLIVTGVGASTDPRGATLAGDGLVVLSLVAAVGWVLTSKRLMQRYDPAGVSALVMMVGTVPLALWVLLLDGAPPVRLATSTWSALAAQGLVATTTANLLWNWGVSHVPMSEAGVFVNLEPVVGTLLGVFLLGDRLGWTGVVGGALIVGAAVVVSRGSNESG